MLKKKSTFDLTWASLIMYICQSTKHICFLFYVKINSPLRHDDIYFRLQHLGVYENRTRRSKPVWTSWQVHGQNEQRDNMFLQQTTHPAKYKAKILLKNIN